MDDMIERGADAVKVYAESLPEAEKAATPILRFHRKCVTQAVHAALQPGDILPSSLEVCQEWQPIETAPKDGTQILLAEIGHGAFLGWWGAHDQGPDNWWFLDPALPGDCRNSWIENYGPTHWRPRPPPPRQDQGALP